MTKRPFLSLNNLKRINNIPDKYKISNFVPIEINNLNNSLESDFQNIDENSHIFSSIDDYESIYNVFSGINNNIKNTSGNSKKKKFLKSFPEIYFDIDKMFLYQSVEEFKKILQNDKKIFGIKKVKKMIGIKRHRNSFFKKKNNFEKEINIKDDSFPFNKSKVKNSYNDLKFITKKYIVRKNGRKKEIPKKRKFKSDDIYKKIKSRFHKELKNIINKNLRKSGSKQFFGFIPQCFISNISKPINSKYFNSTYKELLLIDFGKIMNVKNITKSNVYQKEYIKNKEVLNYLDQNPEIDKKSGFNIIKDMKYKDLLNKYFNSEQFENSILQLKEEGESPEYINKYIIKAKNYIEFYIKGNKSKYDKNEESNFDDEKYCNNEKNENIYNIFKREI